MTARLKRYGLGLGAAAMALTLAGTAYVSAQPPAGRPGAAGRFGRGGPGGPGGLMPMGFARLDLTDAQKERVKGIMDSHRDEMRALGDKAMKAHQALEAAASAAPFDEATVRTKAADVASVDADLAVMRARVFNEVYQLLTPDQQAKLKEFQAERAKREQNRPQRGQRGQRPPQQ
jgi:protein CpxP